MFRFNRKYRQPQGFPTSGWQSLGAFVQRLMPALGKRPSIGAALEHLGTMPLTAQSSLALVRLHGETLLLGITPQNISLLAKGGDGAITELTSAAATAVGQEPVAP